MNKQTFVESIKNGKWFRVRGKNNQYFLVKMKVKASLDNVAPVIETLWLSRKDWESMCFSSYDYAGWDIKENYFISYSSSVFLFGDPTPDTDSIYDEKGELEVDKMKKLILAYNQGPFIVSEELDGIWNLLQKNELADFEELQFQ